MITNTPIDTRAEYNNLIVDDAALDKEEHHHDGLGWS